MQSPEAMRDLFYGRRHVDASFARTVAVGLEQLALVLGVVAL